jgi:hypothetical protein
LEREAERPHAPGELQIVPVPKTNPQRDDDDRWHPLLCCLEDNVLNDGTLRIWGGYWARRKPQPHRVIETERKHAPGHMVRVPSP